MRLQTRERSSRAYSPKLILVVICLGIFIAALDQTVIYGALPGMMADINLPVTQLDQASWIVIGYLLGYILAMPLMGRVSDIFGHGRIYILSLLIFIIGSILVALATSLQWMVGARVLQAVGGGAVVPIAMAISGDLFTGKDRAVALGIIGAATEAGAALGPFYGAAIAQFWSWHWIFWINLPFSLVIILIVILYLNPGPKAAGNVAYLDGFIMAAGLALLSIGISQQSGQPYYLARLLGFLAASVIVFGIFAWRSVRSSEPLLHFSMFRSNNFSSANVTNLFIGGALIIAMVNIPLMSDTIMGNSPLEGGLKLLRFTIMLSIGALAGGFLSRRFGYRLPTIVGLILSAVGFFFMSRWTLTVADPQLTLNLAVCGFGFGLVIAPIGTAVLDSVKEEQKGIASSLVVMMRMIGMMIGLSAITAWGIDRFHLLTAGVSLPEILNAPEKLTQSLLVLFNDFFLASMIICLLAIIPALWLRRRRETPSSGKKL